MDSLFLYAFAAIYPESAERIVFVFKAARLSKIKEIMVERGHVDVTALSAMLNVSEVTTRSDLEELEQENFLRRIRGGAVLNEDGMRRWNDAYLADRSMMEYVSEKEYIADIAADMVCSDSWVFVGQGTTCYYVGCALAKKTGMRVVTNNLMVAAAFRQNATNQLLVTGGSLNPVHMYLEGDMLFHSLENLHFSDAFFGVGGVSLENGLTVNGSSEIAIINRVRQLCSRLILVADYSKFDKTSFMRIGYIDMPDTIITNERIPEKYKTYCYDHNIQLFTSYRLPHSASAEELKT